MVIRALLSLPFSVTWMDFGGWNCLSHFRKDSSATGLSQAVCIHPHSSTHCSPKESGEKRANCSAEEKQPEDKGRVVRKGTDIYSVFSPCFSTLIPWSLALLPEKPSTAQLGRNDTVQVFIFSHLLIISFYWPVKIQWAIGHQRGRKKKKPIAQMGILAGHLLNYVQAITWFTGWYSNGSSLPTSF